MESARRVGAHHLVVSGDLTEIGAPGEYETLAELLHESGFPTDKITLVPGNHDMYSDPDGWRWALSGPLAPFATTSAAEVGKVVEVAGVTLLPVDATFHQPVTRSAGYMAEEALDVIERRATDPGLRGRPLVIVQHHPPFVRATSALHWLDGLVGARRMMAVLEAFRHLFVLHGHLHHIIDRALESGVARILGATAVVDDKDSARVRIYDVIDGELRSAGLVAS